jgi:hypothetical protein
MAGVDEIDILDGLQFEQTAAASVIFTIDGDGEAYEAVKSYVVALPPSASAARVIFNGNYDPDGAIHYVRCKVTKLTAIGTLTKTENTQALEWVAIDPDSATASDRMKETGAIDVSDAYEAALHIDVAIGEAEATTGLEVIVQVRGEAALDEWTTLTRFIGPTGTPTSTALAGTEAAGQTTLSVTNPTAANFNHVGKFIFIKNTTAASCEIAWLMACGADA